ncbi:hypothetical protein QJS10_CPA16g00461 [Acorus calamus]|uniref:Uncharacterized protein n=1 Tax=Acorus calamus TaxID=4465 RepID=A0AAV9CXZ5_ACOCL|nr:hypothetical protein QJS10_CPA16g00461 [Acorus calamus]
MRLLQTPPPSTTSAAATPAATPGCDAPCDPPPPSATTTCCGQHPLPCDALKIVGIERLLRLMRQVGLSYFNVFVVGFDFFFVWS